MQNNLIYDNTVYFTFWILIIESMCSFNVAAAKCEHICICYLYILLYTLLASFSPGDQYSLIYFIISRMIYYILYGKSVPSTYSRHLSDSKAVR